MSMFNPSRNKVNIWNHWRLIIPIVVIPVALSLFTGFSTAKSAYVISDGDLVYAVEGYSADISEAFVRAGISLNEDDSYQVSTLNDLTRIQVIRTSVSSIPTFETIPYSTTRRANADLPIGSEQVRQEGKNGIRSRLTQVTAVTGQAPVTNFVGVSTLVQPTDQIIEYGTKVSRVAQSKLSITDDVLVAVDRETGILTTASGKTLPYAKVLTCTATAYTTERQAWKITATGTTARQGAIAVDPSVIPYGTKMYIVSADGSITYGVATAEDCGGAIKGNKIDLFFDSYDECIRFGRRPCTVYILK